MKFTTLAVVAASALSVNAWYNLTTSASSVYTTITYPVGPTGTGSPYVPSGSPSPSGNGTVPSGGLPTKTPVGPSGTSPGGPLFTGAASSNLATSFSGLAAVGMVVAYLI